MTNEIKAATDEQIADFNKYLHECGGLRVAGNEKTFSNLEVSSLIARIEADKAEIERVGSERDLYGQQVLSMTAEIERLRGCVEDMAWQFSSRGKVGGVENINTMGLSALENAFDILGWPDPKPIGEPHD